MKGGFKRISFLSDERNNKIQYPVTSTRCNQWLLCLSVSRSYEQILFLLKPIFWK